MIDFGLNLGIATKPWALLLVGLCFGVLYYVIFRYAIVRFNLPTPGRESDEELAELQKAEAK